MVIVLLHCIFPEVKFCLYFLFPAGLGERESHLAFRVVMRPGAKQLLKQAFNQFSCPQPLISLPLPSSRSQDPDMGPNSQLCLFLYTGYGTSLVAKQ